MHTPATYNHQGRVGAELFREWGRTSSSGTDATLRSIFRWLDPKTRMLMDRVGSGGCRVHASTPHSGWPS